MPDPTSQPQCSNCASIEAVIMGRQARAMNDVVKAVHHYWARFFDIKEAHLAVAIVEQNMSTLAMLNTMPPVDDQANFSEWNKKRLVLLENYR